MLEPLGHLVDEAFAQMIQVVVPGLRLRLLGVLRLLQG